MGVDVGHVAEFIVQKATFQEAYTAWMKDPKNKIEMLAGEVTQVFMQGVRVGEAVARKRYMMDPTVKPVDFLQQERE